MPLQTAKSTIAGKIETSQKVINIPLSIQLMRHHLARTQRVLLCNSKSSKFGLAVQVGMLPQYNSIQD